MARSVPAAIASPRSFGLAAPAGPRLPEDFAIGPLEPPRPSDPDRAAALLVIRGFLDSLLAGKTAEDKVAASRRALLRYGVDEILAAARPTAYRVGSILIDGDAALAPLRLEAAAKGVGGALPSRAAGAIYLRYEEGAWSVEDLELDSLALAAKAEPRRPPFEPAVGSSSQRIP